MIKYRVSYSLFLNVFWVCNFWFVLSSVCLESLESVNKDYNPPYEQADLWDFKGFI